MIKRSGNTMLRARETFEYSGRKKLSAQKSMIETAKEYLGAPYKYGGMDQKFVAQDSSTR
jgi:hypothetical protein